MIRKRGKDQISMRGGQEYDTLTRARKYYHYRPGTVKYSKKTFNRRLRRATIGEE